MQCSAVQCSAVQFARDLGARDREAVWSMLTWGGGRMVTSLEQSVSHLLVTLPLGEQYNMALAKVKDSGETEVVASCTMSSATNTTGS